MKPGILVEEGMGCISKVNIFRYASFISTALLFAGFVSGYIGALKSPYTGVGVREKDGAFYVHVNKNEEDNTLKALDGRQVVSISGLKLNHDNLYPDIDAIEKAEDVIVNLRTKKIIADSLKTHGSLELVFADSTKVRIDNRQANPLSVLSQLTPLFVLGVLLLIIGLLVTAARELSWASVLFFTQFYLVSTTFYTYNFIEYCSFNIGTSFTILAVAYLFNTIVFNFAPVLFLHSFLVFPMRFKFTESRLFPVLLYGTTIVLILLFWTRIFFLGQSIIFFVGYSGGIIAILYRFFSRSTNDIARAQLRWLCLGVTLFVFVFLLTYTLPLALNSTFENGYLFASAAFILVPLSIAFAVLQYRLDDIDLILDTALAYSITIAALTIADVLVSLFLLNLFNHHPISSVLTFTVNAWIILFLYRPLRNHLSNLIGKLLKRNAYSVDNAVLELSNSFLKAIDEQEIIADTVDIIVKCLHPRTIAVYPEGSCSFPATVPFPQNMKDTLFSSENVHRAILPGDNQPCVLVPFTDRGILIAHKKSGTLFNHKDLHFLSIVQRQTAIALAGVRSRRDATQRELELSRTREKIAQEIHDGLGGNLAVASMITEAMENLPADSLAYSEKRSQLREVITQSLYDIRDLIWVNAHKNSTLNHFADFLFERIKKLCSATKIEISAKRGTLPVDTTLTHAVRLNLLRIAQEAVCNTIKHSGAREIEVLIQEEHGNLLLSISDDGCGFDQSQTTGPHYGVKNMQIRAQEIGGKIQINSTGGKGVNVAISVPIAGQ